MTPAPLAPEAGTLGAMIENNARHHAGMLAFVDERRSVTYAEYADRSKRLAEAWYRRGARHQERIAILSQNRVEYVEVYGAAEIAGFIIATVNFRLSLAEMAYILNDCAPIILVFESQYQDRVSELRPLCPSIKFFICIGNGSDWAEPYEDVLASGSPSGPPIRANRSDIAHIIYTSGTTGRPKGCMLGQREEWSAALMMHHVQGGGPGSSILLMMPFFHVGSKRCSNTQNSCGGTVYILPGFDAEQVLEAIERWRVETILLAPVMVQSLLTCPAIDGHDVSSLSKIIYSAAPMPGPLLRSGLARFGSVFLNIYGQTEGVGTALMPSQHLPDGSVTERAWLGSVGQPLPGAEIRVVDEEGRDCPPNIPGEIILRGNGLFRGYWNNSAATIETLRNGWMYSGDIGKLDDHGFLYLVDRKKEVIISGGENIYSREVEEALVTHEDVAEVAVIGVPDEKWGEAVRAIVVLKPEGRAGEQELIDHCGSLIARYKSPKSVLFVPEIPRMANGKVDKVSLKRSYGRTPALDPMGDD